MQDTRGGLTTSPKTERFRPNFNFTAANTTPPRDRWSTAPDDASSPGNKDTEAILERMTYVCGMDYAKCRRKASHTKAFGKHKKVRPPTLCMQDELDGDNSINFAMAPPLSHPHDDPRCIAQWRKRQPPEQPCYRRKRRRNGPWCAWRTHGSNAMNSTM